MRSGQLMYGLFRQVLHRRGGCRPGARTAVSGGSRFSISQSGYSGTAWL